MTIDTRKSGICYYVKIKDDAATLEYGPLSETERDEMALQFICAAYNIGPSNALDCDEWFSRIAQKAGFNPRENI